MKLYDCIKKELKENESIFILVDNKVGVSKGIMEEYTFDQIFNNYTGNEIVSTFWHENGLCIIIKSFDWNEYQNKYKKKNYKQLNLTLGIDEYNELEQVCNRLKISKSDFVRLAIKKLGE